MLEERRLQHYGVKGMKWGVRRTPEELGHRPSASKIDKPDGSVNSLELVLLNLGLVVLPVAAYTAASNVGSKKIMAKASEADLQITKLSQAAKISPPESYKESAKNTNNTRSINKNYTNNCPHTTMAYELRRRGYDVKAKPAPKGMLISDIQKDYGNPERYVFTNLHRSLSYKPINDSLNHYFSELPDGYRGAATVFWKNVQSGHIFNVEKINGKVMFIDSQNGKSGEFKGLNLRRIITTGVAREVIPFYKLGPENYLTRAEEVSFFRIDNAKISEKDIDQKLLRG